jgi:Zn-dependent protease with chaperone function/TPR repeat protein
MQIHRFARFCLVGLLFVAGMAYAQELQIWSARRMLAGTTAVEISLSSRGQKVDQVSRESVARAVDVTERLASAYQMSVPDIYIAKQTGPNAFATLNKEGQPVIGISTDMLRLTGDDEAMLAAAVGHELGHLQAKHVTEGHQRAAAISLFGALVGAAVDVNQARHGRNTGGLGTALGGVGANLANAKFSRDQEREADSLGVRAMAEAGYDPSAASRMWRLMSQRGGGGAGLWFDSHPSHPEREQAMSAMAEQLQSTYMAHAPRGNAGIAAIAGAVADPYPRSSYSSYVPLPAEVAEQNIYARGYSALLDKRFKDAEPLLLEAAQSGDERALSLLGGVAASGELRGADFALARDYYEQAAAKGFGPALRALGLMSVSGRGKPKDIADAVRLLQLADLRGDLRATASLGMLYMQGDGLARNARQARVLAEKAAGGGDALGKGLFGTLLRDGEGGSSDPERGTALLIEAARSVPWAKYQLGISFERGLGTPPDRDRAITAYGEAASSGVAAARTTLNTLAQQSPPAPSPGSQPRMTYQNQNCESIREANGDVRFVCR